MSMNMNTEDQLGMPRKIWVENRVKVLEGIVNSNRAEHPLMASIIEEMLEHEHWLRTGRYFAISEGIEKTEKCRETSQLESMNKNEFVAKRTTIISKMLDNPNSVGIYPTTVAFAELDDLFDELMESYLTNSQRGSSWAQIDRDKQS